MYNRILLFYITILIFKTPLVNGQIPKAPSLTQPDARYKTDILLVVAHPDDETAIYTTDSIYYFKIENRTTSVESSIQSSIQTDTRSSSLNIPNGFTNIGDIIPWLAIPSILLISIAVILREPLSILIKTRFKSFKDPQMQKYAEDARKFIDNLDDDG